MFSHVTLSLFPALKTVSNNIFRNLLVHHVFFSCFSKHRLKKKKLMSRNFFFILFKTYIENQGRRIGQICINPWSRILNDRGTQREERIQRKEKILYLWNCVFLISTQQKRCMLEWILELVSGQFDDLGNYYVNGYVAPADENCTQSIHFSSVLQV